LGLRGSCLGAATICDDHVDSRFPIAGCHRHMFRYWVGENSCFGLPLAMSQHSRQTSTTSIPHRTSSSATSHNSTSGNPSSNTPTESHPAESPNTSHNPPRPQAQGRQSTTTSAPSQARLNKPDTYDIVRRIVSPGSVLFQHQPPPPVTRDRLQQAPNSTVNSMERRHPSSFQQLEKLGEGTYATVRLIKAWPEWPVRLVWARMLQ
jgi:hypothetical protein